MAYGGINKYQSSRLNAIFATPVAIPNATPVATACIRRFFLKSTYSNFSTVEPSAFNAGSASVAPYPRIKPKRMARHLPAVDDLKIGSTNPSLCHGCIDAKLDTTLPPNCSLES